MNAWCWLYLGAVHRVEAHASVEQMMLTPKVRVNLIQTPKAPSPSAAKHEVPVTVITWNYSSPTYISSSPALHRPSCSQRMAVEEKFMTIAGIEAYKTKSFEVCLCFRSVARLVVLELTQVSWILWTY